MKDDISNEEYRSKLANVADLAVSILCYPPNFRRSFCVNICNYQTAQARGVDT